MKLIHSTVKHILTGLLLVPLAALHADEPLRYNRDTRAFERARAVFTANANAATGLLTTGEATPAQQSLDPAVLAAMTNVASTLLCLDETVTKE